MNQDYKFSFYSLYRKAIDIRESDPDEAIRLMTEGYEEATKHNDFSWQLIFMHWRLQVLINQKRDFNMANHFVIEAMVESRKPQYRNFREYICIQNDLILVYDGIDPIGYADEIREAIDMTLDLTTPEMPCHYCQNSALLDYYKTTGQDTEARNQAAKFFAITHSQPHYRIEAYESLCYFSRQDEAWSDLLTLAQQGSELAAERDNIASWILLKAYEMLALHHLGKAESAQKVYDLLMYRVATLKMIQDNDFYHVVCAYHEACGELRKALITMDEYIATLVNSGRYNWECLARMERIRLLQLLKSDYQDEVNQVRELAKNLKSQSQMLEHLEKILA